MAVEGISSLAGYGGQAFIPRKFLPFRSGFGTFSKTEDKP